MHRPAGLRGPFTCFLVMMLWVIVGFSAQLAIPRSLRADDDRIATNPSDPWQISAERIDYDQNLDEYLARGNVSITRQGRILTADTVRLNQKTGDAFADGNVRLVSNSDVLTGDHLALNLNDETGTLSDGTIFISNNHLYLSGRRIRKTGPQTYSAEHIVITTCDGPDPAWELTGRDFEVTIEGYGTAKHSALWAGKMPILYSPYMIFPVKLKRQSGLLMPEMGYSSRKGTEYLQPIYWAINDSSDATFYSHFMSQRGVRNGIEYRYVLDEESKGALYLEGYQDFKIDDGQDQASNHWGYSDDGALRENKDRYWIRMKHDQRLGEGMTAKLDIDVVSDQDYLHEFKNSYNGFSDTRSYFQGTFGRGLDDYNDPIRLNRVNLNRIWSQYSLNADLRWYDDVIKRRQGTEDDTLQQLPVITFDGIKNPLGRTPFYYDLAASYTHFYRINGTRGHRTDLYPRIYYPLGLIRGLSVEPSFGVRQTAWRIDRYETEPDQQRDSLYRAMYDFKLDISTEFYRIYNFDIGGSDLMKHAITPEVVYEYTPEVDQSEYPEFDPLDRIERKNLITYGFTNYFTARRSRKTANLSDASSYTQFLRFKLAQSFDINKQNEDDPEPFSDILAEFDLIPGRYVAIDSDAQWSVYDHRFEVLNAALHLWDARGDHLRADYRYTRETSDTADDGIETLGLAGVLQVSARWALRAGVEQNYYDDLEIERMAGVTYQSPCWGVMLDYIIEDGNQSYTVLFNLGSLGN